MTYRPAPVPPGSALPPPIPAGLQPDAINVAQTTIIGVANAAPTVSIGLTLAALAATAAYGPGPVILLTAVPMIIIANAYRRLNLWKANCGATFEWVGRAISPSLGFFAGWLMIAGNFAGTSAGIVVLAPSVLAVAGSNAASTWPNIGAVTGLQGVVSPAKLHANASSALVYVAQELAGGGWAKVVAFSLALPVIATVGTGIVILGRILYSMATHRVLPLGWARSLPTIRRRRRPRSWSVWSSPRSSGCTC